MLDDVPAVTTLASDAYRLDPEHVAVVVQHAVTSRLAIDFWLLEDDGEAVSTVQTHRTGETVSLWTMATPPPMQRRGYGRALLGGVLRWAAQDGATVGLLGATPAGEPLYRSTGWRVIDDWEIHLNAPSTQFG